MYNIVCAIFCKFRKKIQGPPVQLVESEFTFYDQ